MKIAKRILKLTIAGLLSGAIVGFFQFCAHLVIDGAKFMIGESIYTRVAYLVMVVVFSFISMIIATKVKSVSGSGIPQIELHLRGEYTVDYLKSIPLMFVNCLMSFFSGLSLGSEGPSVLLAGSAGIAVDRVFKEDNDTDIIAYAGACGFACAFLAPLAGVCYAFEEMIHHFRWRKIFEVIYIVAIAVGITWLINPHPLFDFEISAFLPFLDYYVLIIAVLLSVAIGYAFMTLLINTKDLLARFKTKALLYRGVLIFLLAGLLGIYLYDWTGSGMVLINGIQDNTLIGVLLLFLIFRIVFTVISANIPASGGLLIPMLAIGAIIGHTVSLICHQFFGFDLTHENIIILVSMLMVFAVVTKSKWTAIALAVSFAPIQYIIVPAVIGILGAALLSNTFMKEDIYEQLMERMIGKKTKIDIQEHLGWEERINE